MAALDPPLTQRVGFLSNKQLFAVIADPLGGERLAEAASDD